MGGPILAVRNGWTLLFYCFRALVALQKNQNPLERWPFSETRPLFRKTPLSCHGQIDS